MYIQSKFSQNTIERIFADFQINSGEEVLYAVWLQGGRKGFVFTDRRFYWNIKTSIVRNSEVTDVKLPSNIMEKNVNGLSVKIISKEKEKTGNDSKYLYFALISHIGLIRYDAARLSYDEALRLKKIFTQYINESTLPEPRHKSFADKLSANKENALDFFWCLKNGSLFKRQHQSPTTRQDIELRNEKITYYEEGDNSAEDFVEPEYDERSDNVPPESVQEENASLPNDSQDYDDGQNEENAGFAYQNEGNEVPDAKEERDGSAPYDSENADERQYDDAQSEAEADEGGYSQEYNYDGAEEVPAGPGREYLRKERYERRYDDDGQTRESEDEESSDSSSDVDSKKERKSFGRRRLKALLLGKKKAKSKKEEQRYAADENQDSDDSSYADENEQDVQGNALAGEEPGLVEPLQNIPYHIIDVFVTLIYATASLFAVKPILFAKSITKPLSGVGRFFAEIGKLFFFVDKSTVSGLAEVESRSDHIAVLIDKRNCVFAVLLIFYLIGRTLLTLRNKDANKKLCFIFMIGFVLISFILPFKYIIFLLLAFALYGAMQFANGASKMTLLCKVFAFLLVFGMEYYLVHLVLYPGFPEVMASVVQILGLHANW